MNDYLIQQHLETFRLALVCKETKDSLFVLNGEQLEL